MKSKTLGFFTDLKNAGRWKEQISWLLVGVLIFLFFLKTYPIIFVVDDDILTWVIARKGDTISYAISMVKSGRITQFLSTILLGIPMWANSLFIYKVFSIGSILFDIWVWYRLIRDYVSRDIAEISIVLFFGLATINNWHSLFLAYIFSHQILIGLVLLSLYEYLSYVNCKDNRKHLYKSWILYGIAILIYECAVTYMCLFFLIGLFQEKKIKQTFRSLAGHIVLTLLFFQLYFGWRRLYPSHYEGSTFYLRDPIGSVRCLFFYSISSFPLLPIRHLLGFKGLFRELLSPPLEAWLIAGITTAFFYRFLKNSQWKPVYGKFIIFAIVALILPNLPLCLTKKYIEWTYQGTKGYLTYFYTWFFMVVIGVLCCVYLRSKFHRQGFLVFLCVCLWGGVLATGTYNVYQCNIYRDQTRRYVAFDNFMSSPQLETIADGTYIYIPQYRNINNNSNYMKTYTSLYTDKTFFFTNCYEELDFSRPVIELWYDEKEKQVFVVPVEKVEE